MEEDRENERNDREREERKPGWTTAREDGAIPKEIEEGKRQMRDERSK